MRKKIELDFSHAFDFIKNHELEYLQPDIEKAHHSLHKKSGAGKEYTGWLDLPCQENPEISEIKQIAQEIRSHADVFIVIGIGGSYLGARSALGLLNHTFMNQLSRDTRQGPEIYFAGFNLSPMYFSHLMDLLKGKELMVNIISKSGGTLEPALAFRMFKSFMERIYPKNELREKIIVTTDRSKGLLKDMADREGYRCFTIPSDIGGRYSVLTAVGLLPMAVGGIDIDEVLAGAKEGYTLYSSNRLVDNPSYQYAAIRNLLYKKGKVTELLVSYEPSFYYLTEWWKQLFGESEGKDKKGIFPVGMNFTTDLHSLGQYVQDGYRNLFATTLWVEESHHHITVEALDRDADRLNYLSGRTLHEINQKACEGTIMAHTVGQVPNLKITIPEISPYYYGQLIYFFQKTCALSGYLLGVNPFDQPGVEAYKKYMTDLLHQN